jgi:hypothetical protein
MDEDYLRSIRRWLCADPARRESAAGPEPEPVEAWLPLPRTPLE